MTQDQSIATYMAVARQTIGACRYASLITIDEAGHPSSRAVAAFPPDQNFARIVVGTHPEARKTKHVQSDPRVVLSYIDNENRGYLTVIGKARLYDDPTEKRAYWVDRFSAFWPGGPDTETYLLMAISPERLELRSFGLMIAEEPTRWSPATLARLDNGEWRQID